MQTHNCGSRCAQEAHPRDPRLPKKGILFYDITTLLKDKLGFARLIDALSENYIGKEIDLVLGMEARGFIFGPALAYRLNAGFVPVRKPGKLPPKPSKSAMTWNTQHALEVHKDAIAKGQRVLIVDDLLATGGTAVATAELASRLGARIAGFAFVVELDFLKVATNWQNTTSSRSSTTTTKAAGPAFGRGHGPCQRLS